MTGAGPEPRPDSRPLADAPVVRAPDGSLVRQLGELPAVVSMARFELAPGEVAAAVSHRTVRELWHVLSGSGQLWRRQDGVEQLTPLRPGLTASIPLGTAFQFRADADAGEPLVVLGATVPAWPGPAEARPEQGPWEPTVDLG
ncbi:cupin domain-containing protein [Kitasatospora viridis]|uniref:Mannose-6-phosphate isomerase-like protein (Cupin superfamily) n=1 Tax=Kitasatospora viridis TaxID=281105 RepID=A0A561UBP5_9ACTN|nr:cupin domain-containing protein [Kitasatospora viridis]TWF96759.1 mannose-6-phosphate isomerase-like protein (cupin superfamily) [Kitasatospora viridis]